MFQIIWVEIPKLVSNYVWITIILGAFLYFLCRCYLHIKEDEKSQVKVKYFSSVAATIATFLAVINGAFASILLYLLCIDYPRTETSFDYLGLLVGILGALVTVLIGWQLFTNLYTKKDLEKSLREYKNLSDQKIDNALKKLDSKVIDSTVELKNEYEYTMRNTEEDIKNAQYLAIAMSLSEIGSALSDSGYNDKAMINLLNAYIYCSKIKNRDHMFKYIYSKTKKVIQSTSLKLASPLHYKSNSIVALRKAAKALGDDEMLVLFMTQMQSYNDISSETNDNGDVLSDESFAVKSESKMDTQQFVINQPQIKNKKQNTQT